MKSIWNLRKKRGFEMKLNAKLLEFLNEFVKQAVLAFRLIVIINMYASNWTDLCSAFLL